jgi:hypothetical protein
MAQRVTRTGRLDLDHIGPKVGQGFGCKRPGNQLAQFQDFETG